jgi:protein gp37
MAGSSKIEWCDATWNVVTGCKAVSPGCVNCFAARLAGTRLVASPRYAGLATVNEAGRGVWSGEVRLHPDRLDEPLHWRKPCRVFVNSMADLFHEDVPDGFLCRVFKVMGQAERHTFQVLTKRADRMQRFLREQTNAHAIRTLEDPEFCVRWPYPNVWCGVSVEDQRRADERIPLLLQTPAAVRFVSAEPLLGPVDLGRVRLFEGVHADLVRGRDPFHPAVRPDNSRALDWLIVGGESGPGARRMEASWARSLLGQCRSAGIPCFFKQAGSVLAREWRCGDAKGGCLDEVPEEFRVREMPRSQSVP